MYVCTLSVPRSAFFSSMYPNPSFSSLLHPFKPPILFPQFLNFFNCMRALIHSILPGNVKQPDEHLDLLQYELLSDNLLSYRYSYYIATHINYLCSYFALTALDFLSHHRCCLSPPSNLHVGYRSIAAFIASSLTTGDTSCGVSQLNKTCIVAATRNICPLDFESIPMYVCTYTHEQ